MWKDAPGSCLRAAGTQWDCFWTPRKSRALLILSGFPSTSRYTPRAPFRRSDRCVFPYRTPRRCLPILINSLSTKFDAKTDGELPDPAREVAFHCD